MKFFHITAVAALVASAAAQVLGDLPNCAKSCALDALPQACGLEISCICNAKSFINKMACCIQPACSKADQQKTIEAAKKICAIGGVTDIPNSVVCDNSTMTQTTGSSGSGSSTASSTTSPTSTNVAVLGQNKDSSLMAAAGAAAAFAILV
ncbi:uncharacterized protein PFLUO_LOCUS1916 [Penicillium psychrofluorescens]|uniref:uncharacterized protein n=1 Tax=Penicillium psychrofluorescens TaxID=3158075 RepID=UPI003CCDF143